MTTASNPGVDDMAINTSRYLGITGFALIAACYGFARFAFGLFLPRIDAELSLSSTLSGLMSGAAFLTYCVAVILSAWLTERLGPRFVAIGAALIAAAGMAGIAAAPTAPWLAGAVMLAGSSTGLVSPALAAAVAAGVPPGRQNATNAFINAGTGAGVALSGPVALMMGEQWRVAFAGFAAVAFGLAFAVAFILPRRTQDATAGVTAAGATAGATAVGATATGASTTGVTTTGAGTTGVATNGATTTGTATTGATTTGNGIPMLSGVLRRLIAAAFLTGAASTAIWSFGGQLVGLRLNWSGTGAGLLWTAIGAAGIVGAGAGHWIARFGIDRVHRVFLTAMAASVLLVGIDGTSAPLALLGGALFGVAYITITGVYLLWGVSALPERPATGVMIAFLALAIGQTAGASIFGLLMDRFTANHAVILFAALALTAGVARAETADDAKRRRFPACKKQSQQ
ncbi:MAG: MFS transporter [Achromobacter sp.]|uniref:MFS transporter n=1 Tax=Achromobacter sp. TaxID=134375 RepID=UPI0029B80205|nr:MFS transporter [Achromobacter sp.]MDX3986007.1 MFS transporter [Achromobacter sp.]